MNWHCSAALAGLRRKSHGAALVFVLVLTAMLSLLAAAQMRTLAAGQQIAVHARQGEQALHMAQLALRQCEQLALVEGQPVPEPTDPPRWSNLARWTASPELMPLALSATDAGSPWTAQCLVESIVLWRSNPPPHCSPSVAKPCAAGTQAPWSRTTDRGRTVTVRVSSQAANASGASGTWLQSTLLLDSADTSTPSAAAPLSTALSSLPLQVTHRTWRTLVPR